MPQLMNLRPATLDIHEDVGDLLTVTATIREKATGLPWDVPGGTTWEAPVTTVDGVTVATFDVDVTGSVVTFGLPAATTTTLGEGVFRWWLRPMLAGEPVAWLQGTLFLRRLGR